jgi:hypothetical protein
LDDNRRALAAHTFTVDDAAYPNRTRSAALR